MAACASGPAKFSDTLKVGVFHCESNHRIEVGTTGNAADAIQLQWQGMRYSLAPVTTSSGALRYEDSGSGLVWIQIPAKSMLLNANQGVQLANECTLRL